jgi:hypothetical protein
MSPRGERKSVKGQGVHLVGKRPWAEQWSSKLFFFYSHYYLESESKDKTIFDGHWRDKHFQLNVPPQNTSNESSNNQLTLANVSEIE